MYLDDIINFEELVSMAREIICPFYCFKDISLDLASSDFNCAEMTRPLHYGVTEKIQVNSTKYLSPTGRNITYS